jgi:hypothetical protein
VNDRPPTDPIAELVREYDKRWSNLDFVGLWELWVADNPQPIYVGDEYPAPLIGVDELERHWARVAGRLTTASVSTRLHAVDALNDAIVRAVLLSRWRLRSSESDLERSGSSWITMLLIRRDGRYRIFHQMESQVYLGE